MDELDFRLLGPVEVWADGAELDVGPAKPRLVLAALAVTPGRVVHTDLIVDRVWGDHPPAQAAATLYPYLSQLRRALRPVGVGIVRRGGGYLVDTAEDTVDAVRFGRRLAEARAHPHCATELRELIGRWRGTPLDGLHSAWAARYREALENDRLAAWLLVAERAAGQDELADLADDLAELARDHPLSEPLSGYLMRALDRSGRRAEALRHYAELRDRLVDELGEEPGDGLQAIHLAILRRAAPAGRRSKNVPRQLPSVTRHFAGRVAELTALDHLLDADDGAPSAVIAGTAGIGKTALTLRWAHRVADRFPDGQLFVDLHGFDPTGRPTAPADALRTCLESLGTDPGQVPQSVEAQATLFRSLTAGRRMLIVLDNARDTDQVRPLIPGAPGCLVLVTSRNQLTGLIAELGACAITLDLLSPADAECLLSQRIGPARVATDPAAAAALARQCSYLPLALSVLAAEAAQTPDLPLAALAEQLADGRDRLDRLDTADPLTSVRSVLSWSYDAQDHDARRLFRLLGLHPGPDISAVAAASLAGRDPKDAARLLGRLCRATLLGRPTVHRYSHHDLLRAYAAEIVTDESPAQRQAAVRRMLDHYLHTTYHAVGLLNPDRDELGLGRPEPGAQPEVLADEPAALSWFAAEIPVLTRLVDLAGRAEHHVHCWQLADLVARYLGRQGRWSDAIAIEHTGLDSARALDDPAALGVVERGLGYFCARTGRHAAAQRHVRRALQLAGARADRIRLARTLGIAAFAAAQRQRYETALAYAKNSLTLYEATGSSSGQARLLASISWYLAQLGQVNEAIAKARHAVELATELGNVKALAGAHDTLGYLYRRQGRREEAVRSYQESIRLFGQIEDRYYLAAAMRSLGDVHSEAGDLAAARGAWAAALRIFEELGHPLADQVQDRLVASARR